VKGLNPSAALDKLRSLFSGFTGGQKAMTAIAVVVALVGAGLFVSWASKPTYAPLFSGLSSTDAAAVTAKLAEAKEPYQLADGGQTILVPQADVYQQRITLSGEGLPSGNGGGDGYSLLDKQSMTSSDFQQQVTYQRALEGELRKTIEAIDGVQTAVVHLAVPKEDVFTENAAVPTASVLVQTSPASPLKPAQVEAIVHLVSSSVPKLTADQVTVADSSGRVLNSGGEGGASAQNDARAEQAQSIEDDTSSSVQSMLDKLVGPGHAVVRVDAALNFDQTKVDREEYIANKLNPPLTDSVTKETYKGAGAGSPVGGVLGPDNNAVPSGTATGGNNSYVKQSDNRTNAVGTLKTSTTRAPGQISRMTVAVVLDQLVAGGVNDAEVTKLVTSAAGLDPKRGDVVTVSKLAFDTQAAAAAKKELDAAAADKQRADMFNMAKTGGLIVLIALALFIGVRRSRKEQRTPVDLGELPVYRDEPAGLPSAPMAMAVTSASSAPVLPPAPANALAESNLQARNEIGQLIEQQPDEVARLLRGWLVDRRP